MKVWRKEFTLSDLQCAIDQINEIRTITIDGRVKYSSRTAENSWKSFLATSLQMGIKSDAIRKQLIGETLDSVMLPEQFTEAELKRVLDRQFNMICDKGTDKYRVVFPLWNKPSFLIGQQKIDDVTLNFDPSLQTAVYKTVAKCRDRQQSELQFSHHFTNENKRALERCCLCFALVNAGTFDHAVEQALRAMFKVLGFVNMSRDAVKLARNTYPTRGYLPVSDVLLAPHITVHFLNGEVTQGRFWLHNWNGGPTETISAKANREWQSLYEDLLKSSKASPWREDCEAAAVRYFRAFSNSNLKESFLEGWQLFENVSGERHEKISEQVIRGSHLFENTEMHHVLGKHLQKRRNLISHGHELEVDDYEVLAFQMRWFVSSYLLFFIRNPFEFEAKTDLWEFLDISPSKKKRDDELQTIMRRQNLLAKAAKFRRET